MRRQRGSGVIDMLNKAQKLNKTLKEKKLASTLLRLVGKNKLADRAYKLGYGRRRKARMPRRGGFGFSTLRKVLTPQVYFAQKYIDKKRKQRGGLRQRRPKKVMAQRLINY